MTAGDRSLHIIGAGLIGTSLALAASAVAYRVSIEDADERAAEEARHRLAGAGGSAVPADAVDLVVVAVPPAVTGSTVAAALQRHPTSTVLDVASVKTAPVDAVRGAGGDLRRYVPSHPLAGAATAGPLAARAELFQGRIWALCPTSDTSPAALLAAGDLVRDCGATAVELSAADHDRAVAVTSHLPQLVSSALAATVGTDATAALLAGPALLEMTRIADSPAELWRQIAVENRWHLGRALTAFRDALQGVVTALAADTHPVAAAEDAVAQAVADLIQAGHAGRSQLDTKHRGAPDGAGTLADGWAWCEVRVDDRPGRLAQLFELAAIAGVNIEDVRIDHAPQQPTGTVALAVPSASLGALRRAFAAAGLLPADG